ncbi:MAG: hypothetical protein ACK49G_03920 [Brevundimonas sp.]|jgi:hypothetical protein|uniref:hypothetical protein n=2 Tax=Brevundimonas sp. TaxID=1871086 RepID=UPI00391D0C1B
MLMPLLESPKAKDLLTYWEDCQSLKQWSPHADLVDSFFDELVPARLREAKTPLGVTLNLRLRALDPRQPAHARPERWS